MIAEEYLDNLDGQWPDDLEAYAAKLKAADVAPGDVPTRNKLVAYAETKAKAMRLRAACEIPAALRLENECDEIYKTLPGYARW